MRSGTTFDKFLKKTKKVRQPGLWLCEAVRSIACKDRRHDSHCSLGPSPGGWLQYGSQTQQTVVLANGMRNTLKSQSTHQNISVDVDSSYYSTPLDSSDKDCISTRFHMSVTINCSPVNLPLYYLYTFTISQTGTYFSRIKR